MKTTAVTLNEHLAGFVQDAVATGRYDSESDVLRAGLRLLEEEELRLEHLRAALDEGETSGSPVPVTREDILGSLD